MTKEEVFNKINDVYEEWDGGQIHLDMTSVDQIKDIIQEAINCTHSCTELPTSTQLLSDCKKRFKELEGKGNLDFRSYKNGYLDSFSKNVVSKIK